jgi:hypothetical protein
VLRWYSHLCQWLLTRRSDDPDTRSGKKEKKAKKDKGLKAKIASARVLVSAPAAANHSRGIGIVCDAGLSC